MLKHARAVPYTFGGEVPEGWLPAVASRPLSTPPRPVLLDVTIEAAAGGCLLRWDGPTPEDSGDCWYATLAEAEAEAERVFGVTAPRWETAP